MVYIYAIKLEQNKYYIGKTNNPGLRLNDHFNSSGSAWTKKYKPIKVLELIPNCDSFDEDKYTKIYMSNYGINNVRGGSYCELKLSKYQLDSLSKELCTISDKCYNCGEKDHFIKECPLDFYIISENDFTKEIIPPVMCYVMCYRCGRNGHTVDTCFAKSHLKGKSLHGCYHCGREGHWKINCDYITDIYGRDITRSLGSKLYNFFSNLFNK